MGRKHEPQSIYKYESLLLNSRGSTVCVIWDNKLCHYFSEVILHEFILFTVKLTQFLYLVINSVNESSF